MTTDSLIQAAQAVIDRWDSPSWKDLPATADYIHTLRKAVAEANRSEISVVDEITEEMRDSRYNSDYRRGIARALAALRPYLRTTEPVMSKWETEDGRPIFGEGSPHNIREHLDTLTEQPDETPPFDIEKARKDLKPAAWELLKVPVVQSLLYDINLLPEQITTGKHWFYMLSVLSHMDSALKRESGEVLQALARGCYLSGSIEAPRKYELTVGFESLDLMQDANQKLAIAIKEINFGTKP